MPSTPLIAVKGQDHYQVNALCEQLELLAKGRYFLQKQQDDKSPALEVLCIAPLPEVDALAQSKARLLLLAPHKPPYELREKAFWLQTPARLEEIDAHIQRLLAMPEGASEPDLPLAGKGVYVFAERAIKPHVGAAVYLTDKEAALLHRLVKAQGEVVAREALLENIWGYGEEISTHTLETHMYRLRAKLREALQDDSMIETAEGGYRFALTTH